jgi:glycosyltransferase involved in cell wall biosynthesis
MTIEYLGSRMDGAPYLSVIVPVRDGGAAFERCLSALRASAGNEFELIVVDDGSRDDSGAKALASGARVIRSPRPRGPGAARNLGAETARGEWLLFVDSDCEVGPHTLATAASAARAGDGDAIFGSYDDAPAAAGLVARYKNLFHHYVHQRSGASARSFWAGCGAVRRAAFLAVGGFDERRYPRPSIEDIDMGYRLADAGYRIRFRPDLTVKHLKAWTLRGLVRSDVLDRGVPWTELMLRRGRIPDELNVRWRERVSVAAAWLLIACLAASPWLPLLILPAAVCAVWLAVAHFDFYRFLGRREGVGFALASVPLHWLYLAYCGVAFLWGAARHARKGTTVEPSGYG